MKNNVQPVRLAMLGMIPGNGHPYSWSAIINGYDEVEMARCPYAGIPVYLKEGRARIGIPGVRVSHVWTDDPADAVRVAAAARISHVVSSPEDVIGEVDGVVIATDDGTDHARRARPFVEAGLPVFIDKPLATSESDLGAFVDWHQAGAKILSSSGARYMPELEQLRSELPGVGEIFWIAALMIKSWERYGIHRVEPMFRLLGPGFQSVTMGPKAGVTEVATLTHSSGACVTLAMADDVRPSFNEIRVVGSKRVLDASLVSTFDAFKRQLEAFVSFVRTGVSPIPFEHTLEMMGVLIAGIRSREQGNRPILVADVLAPFRERLRLVDALPAH
ncbi:MAG TPA: Gfo/Idh/MocA family oxidoreductase [Opitutaceae bacterium]|nr:Gfo/Idh/MocA family oxidoreductase [Opitutaceae bacterium]